MNGPEEESISQKPSYDNPIEEFFMEAHAVGSMEDLGMATGPRPEGSIGGQGRRHDVNARIPIVDVDVKGYLDSCIGYWRKEKAAGDPKALYYIDAFQSVRVSLFGKLLEVPPMGKKDDALKEDPSKGGQNQAPRAPRPLDDPKGQGSNEDVAIEPTENTALTKGSYTPSPNQTPPPPSKAVGTEGNVDIGDETSLRNDVTPETVADLEGQIDRLANFILNEVDGEPPRDETAVDTAIRLMKEWQAVNALMREAMVIAQKVLSDTAELLGTMEFPQVPGLATEGEDDEAHVRD